MTKDTTLGKFVARLSQIVLPIGSYRAFAVVDKTDNGGSLITPAAVDAFDASIRIGFTIVDFTFPTSSITSTVRAYFNADRLPKTDVNGALFAWDSASGHYIQTATKLEFVLPENIVSPNDIESVFLGLLHTDAAVTEATEAANAAAESANEAAEAASGIVDDIDGHIDERVSVLAHADDTLKAGQQALAERLDGIVSGKALVESLNVRDLGVWGNNNLVLTGSGAPTAKPDRAGQFYIDTANDALYKSVGNAAVSDWRTV
ncbi:MAG: hypothetical protein IJQ81_06615 [Oscillibacter sp.]|nr:hypothetical protein [Oscillibacter sp.]